MGVPSMPSLPALIATIVLVSFAIFAALVALAFLFRARGEDEAPQDEEATLNEKWDTETQRTYSRVHLLLRKSEN